MKRLLVGLALLPLLMATRGSADVTFVIVNVDGPGEGLNDPTPASPVGGNPGTTLGQLRQIALQAAADVWGQLLDSPVPILINASFDPLTCPSFASGGASFVYTDFVGAPIPDTWYVAALANRLAGADLSPGEAEISARFNSACISFYYGLDGNDGPGQVDLVAVAVHELAHGLGFTSLVSRSNGSFLMGRKDIYSTFLFDTEVGQPWTAMSDAERLASMQRPRKVVFDGPRVTAAVPTALDFGVPTLTVASASIGVQDLIIGTSSFGAPLGAPVSAEVALVTDAILPTADACSPLVADLTGKIALLDRGTCTLVEKAKNAQNAGAIGAVMADNVAGSPPDDNGGFDPTVTIPFVRITQADGDVVKLALSSEVVTATLRLDMTKRTGADSAGRALVYTPTPIRAASSLNHFDPLMAPTQLLEPSIEPDSTRDPGLALPLLKDLGWTFGDEDEDGVPDAVDPCVSVGGAHDFVKPRVVIGNFDLVPDNDTLLFSGRFAISAPFGDLDPSMTGARIVITDHFDGTVLDVALPGGDFAGKGTRGWKANGKGTMWKYRDATGAPLEGIASMLLVDQNKQRPNLVKLTLAGKKGNYPLFGIDDFLRVAVVLGDGSASQTGLCGTTSSELPCLFGKTGKKATCEE